MRHIDSDELARMTATAVTSFNDACDLYHSVASQDSDTGEVVYGFDSNPSLAIDCGFSEAGEGLVYRGQVISIDADAVLRLPASQSVKVNDRVIARAKTYQVSGVTPGRNVQIAKLMEYKI